MRGQRHMFARAQTGSVAFGGAFTVTAGLRVAPRPPAAASCRTCPRPQQPRPPRRPQSLQGEGRGEMARIPAASTALVSSWRSQLFSPAPCHQPSALRAPRAPSAAPGGCSHQVAQSSTPAACTASHEPATDSAGLTTSSITWRVEGGVAQQRVCMAPTVTEHVSVGPQGPHPWTAAKLRHLCRQESAAAEGLPGQAVVRTWPKRGAHSLRAPRRKCTMVWAVNNGSCTAASSGADPSTCGAVRRTICGRSMGARGLTSLVESRARGLLGRRVLTWAMA
jgi:hypothetical protein